jgi:hypothetical protein
MPTPQETDQTVPQLSAEEVQELRQVIERIRSAKETPYRLPLLPISEADRDRFADSLCVGKPYSEEFERLNGKIKVKLRSLIKWEEDLIIAQLTRDFGDQEISTEGQYANRLNVYSLCFKMTELNGVPQVSPKKNTDLREFVSKSLFENMPEPKLYILIALLSQFDTKVTALCREATPDFSKPATDS